MVAPSTCIAHSEFLRQQELHHHGKVAQQPALQWASPQMIAQPELWRQGSQKVIVLAVTHCAEIIGLMFRPPPCMLVRKRRHGTYWRQQNRKVPHLFEYA